MRRELTVQNGVEMVIRRPSQAAALLAKTLSDEMNAHAWIDAGMKLRFCMLFISNLIDGSVESEVSPLLMRRAGGKPLLLGIRLLRRRPDMGLKVLVAIIMTEIRERQQFSPEEQMAFYDEVFGLFFPEVKFRSLRKARGLA